jgi:hypothetical protein
LYGAVSADQVRNVTSIVVDRSVTRSVRNWAPWLPTGLTLSV